MEICTVLERHINQPYSNRSLDVQSAYGIVTDASGHNAMKIAFTLDEHDQIVDVAFRSFGHPVLIGCGSFLTEVLRGQTVGFAARVTSRQLSSILRLSDYSWCADLAVEALWRAVCDSRKPRTTLPRAAVRPGRRRVEFVPPLRSAGDTSLLRPGETLDGLVYERAILCNSLMNLDLCLQVALSIPPAGPKISERKMFTCSSDLTALKAAIPSLSETDRALLARVGLRGQSVTQAGAETGVSADDILLRMWEMARKVQTLWRCPSGLVIRAS